MDTRTPAERMAPYPARSGFLAPWQAELLAAWRYAYATGQAVRLGIDVEHELGIEERDGQAWMIP